MDNLAAFNCKYCGLLFWITRSLVDVVNMVFIDEEDGGGIHCPRCRDNNSVTYGYVREVEDGR